MREWILIFCLLPLVQSVAAQKIEFEVFSKEDIHEVVPSGKDGFFVFRKLDKYERGKEKTWSLHFYNSALKEQWSREYEVSKKYDYVKQTYAQGNLYVLFYRESRKSFNLYRVNAETGDYTTKEFRSFSKITVTQFKVFDDNLFIGGMFNDNLSLFHFNMKSSHIRTLETINAREGFIESIEQLEDPGKISVVTVNRVKKRSFVVLKVYSKSGEPLEEIKVDLGEDRNLLSGNISNINDKSYWLMGTYAPKGEFRSRGLYVAGIREGELSWIRFYSYKDFTDFLNFISEEDKKEYIEKFVRKKEADQNFFEYRVVPHKATESEQGVTIVAEACFPTYKTVSNTYFDAMGLPHTTYYEVFDGWKYTHAMVLGFDKNGRVYWENSFPIENIKSFVVKKTLNVLEARNHTEITYLHDNQVKSMAFDGQKLTKLTEQSDATSTKNRTLTNESPETVEHWYEGNYLTWGRKKVATTTGGEKTIFYCEKIVFRNNGNKF